MNTGPASTSLGLKQALRLAVALLWVSLPVALAADDLVIYSRAKWHHWSGGRVFNMHGEGGGAAGAGVVFRYINIEDPWPTLQQFFVCMTLPEPYSKDAEKRKAGDLSGVLFQNISIAAPSVLGEPQILHGQADARIRNLTFENLTVAGKPVTGPEFFKANEFVDSLHFKPAAKP